MARRKNPSPCSGTDQRYVDAPLPVLEPTRLERFCRIVTPQYVRPISGSPVGPSDDIASLDHNHNVPFSVIEHPVDFLRNGAGIAPTSFHHCLQKKPFNCGLVLGETAEKAPLPASDTSRFSCPTSPRSSHDLIRPSPPRHGEDGELAKERKHDNTSASPVQTPACETATGFPIPSSVSKNFPTYEDRALAALDGVHLPVHASHHQLPFMSSMPATPSSVLFETARSSSKPSPPVSSTRVCLSPLCTNGEGTHEPYSHEEIKTQAGCVASGAHSLISSSPPPAPNAAKSKVPDTSARASNLPPHSSSIEAAKEEHRKPMHQEKDRIDLPSESESGLEYGRFVSSTENKQDSTTRIDNAKERTNAVGLEALQGVSSGIHSVTSTACVQVRCRDSHYALNIRPSESFPGVDVAAGCVNSHGTSKKEVEKEPFASPSQPTSICVKGDISSPSSLPLPAEGSSAKCCEMSPSPQGHQDIAVRIECSPESCSAENACLLGEKVPPAQRIYSRKNEHLPHVEEVVNQLVVSSPSRTSFSGLSFHRNVFASISQQVEQHQVLLAAKQHDSVGGRTAHQARTTANLKTIHLHAVPAFQPEMSNQSGEGEQRDTLPDHQQQRTPHRSPADVDGKPRSPGSTHPGASGLLEQSQAGCEMPSTSDDSGGIKEARIPTFVTAMLPTGIPTRVQREPTVGCPPEDVKSSVAVQLERKEAYSLSRTSAVSHLPRQRVPNPDTAFCNFKEKTCISYTLDPLVALSPASDSHPTPLSNKSANSPASTNACVSLIQSSSSSIPEPMPSSLSSPLQPLELPLASRPKNSAACWPSRDSESASCDFPGSGEVSRLCSSGKMPEIASPNRAASGTAQRQICEDQRDVGLHVASTPVDHDAKTRCRPGTSLTDWLSRLPVSEADAKRIAVSVGDFIERKASRQRAGSLPSDTPPDQCGTLEAVPDSGEDGQANCSLTEEDLDLHLVAGDVSRQRWINHFPVSKSEGKESQKQKDSMVELVTDAVSIFCTMNGVCYWQGRQRGPGIRGNY
ncbi:conserved hypothetical protein [Neospora caninum Liverpool]|uniref:Uncharacterized protein n=1 Tax=Neospora caninum (strain Liverpool) TaxID=572307 RepID=F0VDR1_NEOCL|nr:conserved hypothetical protein [Neospora caninum Liverpool]CBZ51854.1 conserved hypothetical protein [Neospora caninum Liverpool]|eukprot:XP_003881887.1 conserved hypothetical protein [Neospora caninum Liverpool]